MNRFKNFIGNKKLWIGVGVVSLTLNIVFGLTALHYRDEARSQINTITVSWHKSNENFRPIVSVPGVCYEKEIVIDGNQMTLNNANQNNE